MEHEKPYLFPAPRVLMASGKTVPLTSLPEEEQRMVEAQIRMVSAVSQLDFTEDDEWRV